MLFLTQEWMIYGKINIGEGPGIDKKHSGRFHLLRGDPSPKLNLFKEKNNDKKERRED